MIAMVGAYCNTPQTMPLFKHVDAVRLGVIEGVRRTPLPNPHRRYLDIIAKRSTGKTWWGLPPTGTLCRAALFTKTLEQSNLSAQNGSWAMWIRALIYQLVVVGAVEVHFSEYGV